MSFQVFLLGSGFRVLKDFKFGFRVPVYWWLRVLKDFLSLGLGSLFFWWFSDVGFRGAEFTTDGLNTVLTLDLFVLGTPKWEFPKIRGALFGGPYNKDPTI